MSIIITETRNGRATPNNVFVCNDEDDFVSRIRETQLQRRSGDELVETVKAAIDWLDEAHAQRTCIITEADYAAGAYDDFSGDVDAKAKELEWAQHGRLTNIDYAEADPTLLADCGGSPEDDGFEFFSANFPGATVSNQCYLAFNEGAGRGGIVFVGSGSSGETSWTDASSAGDVLRRYELDAMQP